MLWRVPRYAIKLFFLFFIVGKYLPKKIWGGLILVLLVDKRLNYTSLAERVYGEWK